MCPELQRLFGEDRTQSSKPAPTCPSSAVHKLVWQVLAIDACDYLSELSEDHLGVPACPYPGEGEDP